MWKRELGRAGEKAAAKALKRAGYRIVDRNFSCKSGEIDLIAKDKGTLVFVEVKTRSSDEHGPPGMSIDSRKRRRIMSLAKAYVKHKRLYDLRPRFDIYSILWKEGQKPEINHIPAAFTEDR